MQAFGLTVLSLFEYQGSYYFTKTKIKHGVAAASLGCVVLTGFLEQRFQMAHVKLHFDQTGF